MAEKLHQRSYCKDRSEEGYICDLYRDHEGPHKDKHLHHAWGDVEESHAV